MESSLHHIIMNSTATCCPLKIKTTQRKPSKKEIASAVSDHLGAEVQETDLTVECGVKHIYSMDGSKWNLGAIFLRVNKVF